MKITLSKAEVMDALEIGEVIKESAGKHDCTTQTVVFPKDGKHYKFHVSVSYNEGVQVYGDTIATEVRAVQKNVTVWEDAP